MELFLFPAPVGMAVSFKPAPAGFICSVLYETYPSEEVSHLWTQPLVRRGEKTGTLNRNDAIRLGARGVPPAVFGVPPKTSPPEMDKPCPAPTGLRLCINSASVKLVTEPASQPASQPAA